MSLLDKMYMLAVLQQKDRAALLEGMGFHDKAKNIRDKSWMDFVEPEFHDMFHERWTPPEITPDKEISLMERGSLERYLVGAIRDSINMHGPVTRDTAPSMAKRLIGAIKSFGKCK